jgi:nucleoside 2-deoxyribosyltransferase
VRIYVAGKWSRRAEAAALARRLEKQGHEITHPWWEHEDPLPGTIEEADRNRFYARCAADDLGAVQRADLVVLIHDPGCRGAFVELGAALAYGKPIRIVWGTTERPDPVSNAPIFYWLDGVLFHDSAEVCAEYIGWAP